MSEILVGQSYYLRFDPKLWEAMQPYPPLGSLYACSLLCLHGYDVAFFDSMLAGSEQEWERRLRQERPRFALIYEDNFNYLSKMCLGRMRQAAFAMLEMAKDQGCITIVCGADASDHPSEYLKSGADFVLVGEGELTLVELLKRLDDRTAIPFEAILGLAYPGRINPRRPEIRDLDSLPFPAWDLVDVERYRRIWLKRHGYYSMNMVTTRGCPFHCNWCAKPIWGQRYHARSPQNVVEEMVWLKLQYQPDHLWFADDILGLKPGWLQEFAGAVERSQARIPFKCLSRADLLLRPGEIESLERAGCRTVWLGAESGSQKILDAMDKGTQVSQIAEAASRLRAAGIESGFFIQFGYPGETRQDIRQTFELVRRCAPDDIGVSISYPLPGTRFYENVRLELGEKQNWDDSADLAMLYKGPFTTDFYRQLHILIHKEFRLRKTWAKLTGGGLRSLLSASLFRLLARIGFYLLTLPLARWRLERLARRSHTGLAQILPHLPADAASQPTPQSGGYER